MVLWGCSQVSDRHRISLSNFVTRTFSSSTYHILLRRLQQFNCEILNDRLGGNLGIDGDAGHRTNGGARGFREVFRVVLEDAWLGQFVTFIAGMDVMSCPGG